MFERKVRHVKRCVWIQKDLAVIGIGFEKHWVVFDWIRRNKWTIYAWVGGSIAKRRGAILKMPL